MCIDEIFSPSLAFCVLYQKNFYFESFFALSAYSSSFPAESFSRANLKLKLDLSITVEGEFGSREKFYVYFVITTLGSLRQSNIAYEFFIRLSCHGIS